MADKLYCDDWSCPARVSCANHFGRSKAYAACRDPGTNKVMHGDGTPFDRHASKDRQSCSAYAFDTPRDWLMPKPGQISMIGPIHGWFRA